LAHPPPGEMVMEYENPRRAAQKLVTEASQKLDRIATADDVRHLMAHVAKVYSELALIAGEVGAG